MDIRAYAGKLSRGSLNSPRVTVGAGPCRTMASPGRTCSDDPPRSSLRARNLQRLLEFL